MNEDEEKKNTGTRERHDPRLCAKYNPPQTEQPLSHYGASCEMVVLPWCRDALKRMQPLYTIRMNAHENTSKHVECVTCEHWH